MASFLGRYHILDRYFVVHRPSIGHVVEIDLVDICLVVGRLRLLGWWHHELLVRRQVAWTVGSGLAAVTAPIGVCERSASVRVLTLVVSTDVDASSLVLGELLGLAYRCVGWHSVHSLSACGVRLTVIG